MRSWNELAWYGFLAGAAFKSVAVLGVASMTAMLLRRRSAAERHLVWNAAFVAVLALPILSLSLSAMRVPVVSALTPARLV